MYQVISSLELSEVFPICSMHATCYDQHVMILDQTH